MFTEEQELKMKEYVAELDKSCLESQENSLQR